MLPPPGDLPNPGIEPASLMSSALTVGSRGNEQMDQFWRVKLGIHHQIHEFQIIYYSSHNYRMSALERNLEIFQWQNF